MRPVVSLVRAGGRGKRLESRGMHWRTEKSVDAQQEGVPVKMQGADRGICLNN